VETKRPITESLTERERAAPVLAAPAALTVELVFELTDALEVGLALELAGLELAGADGDGMGLEEAPLI